MMARCYRADDGANWSEVEAANVDCIALGTLTRKTLLMALPDGSIRPRIHLIGRPKSTDVTGKLYCLPLRA